MKPVSAAVMAHPSRERWVPELLAALPGATPTWDERQDRWDTGRRSMLAHEATATWHLVVQDDAVLCDGFWDGVNLALAAVPPERPVSFYTGKVRPHADKVTRLTKTAARYGRSWIEAYGPWWGVAVAVPTAHIPAMLAFGDRRTDIANYDRRLSAYFESLGILCWYSVPSLADHRTGPENPSLVPGRGSGELRCAYSYIGEGDPRAVDWWQYPRGYDGPRRTQPLLYRNRKTKSVRRAHPGTRSARELAAMPGWERVVEVICASCGQPTYEPWKEPGA